jgi:hypothetical protein
MIIQRVFAFRSRLSIYINASEHAVHEVIIA